jgi:hypothetical protein
MNLRKITTLVIGAGLMLSLVGAGVGATFTWSGTATQPITIETLALSLNSTTSGATVSGNSLTCPTIVVDNSAGFVMGGEAVPVCNVTIASVGTMPARNVSAFMTVTSNGAELGSFQVAQTGLIGPATHLLSAPANTPLGAAVAFPASVNLTFDYGDDIGTPELTNVSMGKTITVTFSFTTAQ